MTTTKKVADVVSTIDELSRAYLTLAKNIKSFVRPAMRRLLWQLDPKAKGREMYHRRYLRRGAR